MASALMGIAFASSAYAQSLLPEPADPHRDTLFSSQSRTKAPAEKLGLMESTILSTRPMSLARAAAEHDNSLLAFQQPKSALTLEGEDDTANLSFMLDREMLAAGGDLVIAYRNAVSVMPETSMMSVSVNGTPIGDFAIRSPSNITTQKLGISPALLRPGLNDVRLRVVQRHRVDCSMEATYELWTEIDPQLSGFRSNSTNRTFDFENLLTIGRNDNGLTDLRLVLPEGAGAEALNRAAPLVQTIALALNREDVLVSVAETGGVGPGIDLMVVTDEVPASAAALTIDPPYGLSVSQSGDPRRSLVSLRTATSREIPGMLLNAIAGPLKPLLDSGVRAETKGEIRAEASSTYSLADAGYVATPFSGRLFRTHFDMVLPSDFYPAEYDTIDLALNAATSPGLKPTSQLLVRVNGHIVKSLPMRNTDGDVFSSRVLELPLRAFRPGRNQIEILAEIERASDDSCVFTERSESTPRFILLDTTEIRVPKLARVARLPELAAMAGAAYPYVGSKGVDVYALKPDANAISAAMTMIAKMSLAAREPILTHLAFGAPPADHDGNALVIAPNKAVEDLARLGPESFPKPPAQIDFAYNYGAADPISTSSIHLPGAAMPMSMTTDPVALLDAFRQTTRALGEGTRTVNSLSDTISDGFRAFRYWLNYERPSDLAPLVEPRRKAMLTQRPSASGDGVVTWLTADTPLDMMDTSMMLADPTNWSRLEGENVVFDLDNDTIRSVRPESYFSYQLKDFGPGNLRRVVAAWFSDHFRIYVALVLGLMAGFAVWVGRAVPRAGVRTDQ